MKIYERAAAVIDLNAAEENMKEIVKKVNNKAKIMAVIKADAYGHGAVPLMKTFLKAGASLLAVSNIDEACELRKNNSEVPILILGYTHENRFPDVINNNITQCVFSLDFALRLSEAAKKLGKDVLVHIKLDTGMGRIGFLPDDRGLNEIKSIANLPNIKIDGIFTHFSTADEEDKAYTVKQKEIFKSFIKRLEDEGIYIKEKHSSNSAGIMDFDDFCGTIVRPGIILYGLNPSDEIDKNAVHLKPVMSIKSVISHVKTVPAGTFISYGRTYKTECEKTIATVPVGYADGYLRGMQNGGKVIVNGEFAPIVGRVCMDQFMIDVSHIKNVKPEDEVIIMGESCGKKITADDMAEILGTINYEVVCTISKRIPRIYIKDKEIVEIIKHVY